MDNQQADRMRALWKSGRDKFQSFFTHLAEVRQEIGDDALPAWCIDELRIGLSVISKMTSTLNAVDEEKVKSELAEAQKAEKDRRATERANRGAAAEAARKAREDAACERERQRIEHERQIAEAKAATERARIERDAKLAEAQAARARADAEREKVEHNNKRRERDRKNPKKRGPDADAKRRKREATSRLPDTDTKELLKRLTKVMSDFERNNAMRERTDEKWIELSVSAALLLAELRGRFTANHDFSAQLEKHGIDLDKDERAALINLGQLGEERLREILGRTSSRSHRVIWSESKSKPVLKVVE